MNKKQILITVFALFLIFLIIMVIPHKKRLSEQEIKINNKKILEKKDIIKKLEGKIEKGKIIIDTLTEKGIPREQAYQLVKEIKPVYNLAKIHTGNNFFLYLKNNDFYKFIYNIDSDNYLKVVVKNGVFVGNVKKIPYKIKKEKVKITIKNSLYEAIMEIKEKPELSELLASLYDYDIDFNRDLRTGDTLTAIVEKKYLNGDFIKYGNILSSSFVNKNTRIDIIRYVLPDGTIGYYHPDGRAVKKMFLKSPLPFMIVTSRFGFRRHPILGFSAKHNGVDLRARVGTKVRTTANGVVVSRGYNRVMGRFIIIRHPNGYRTHYYHLSRIKSKIRRGVRVVQGEIIGYSGNTGRSTGPHLHYGVQKYGRYINPLRLKSPSLKPIPKKYLNDFKKYASEQIKMLYSEMSLNINKTIKSFTNQQKSLKIIR